MYMENNYGQENQLENVEVVEVENVEMENVEVENVEVESESVEVEDVDKEEEVTESARLKSKVSNFKEQMEDSINGVNASLEFAFKNDEGGTISPRTPDGSAILGILPVESIKLPPRLRQDDEGLFALQEQIKLVGLLQPIHVVEYGDMFVVLDGVRRLQAMINLGYTEIFALVDSTIPSELVRYYEGLVNGVKPYKFSEKVMYGQYFKDNQPLITYETIEGILGLRTGEFLKALYINELKDEFFDTYQQVEKGKLSIEQGFKKIEKEIEKREKEETSALDDLNSGALDEQLRNKNELLEMSADAGTQELGNRKILPADIRRNVESRDKGYCQCCGYGKNEPELMGVFNVHHMVAVQYGGSDNPSNLILVCNNCHTLIHKYESSQFLPDKDFYEKHDYVKKIIVLGNILTTMKQKGIVYLKTKHPDTMRVINAGKLTLGKALQNLNVDLRGEAYFEGSPYNVFMEQAQKIDNGIFGGEGELSKVNYEDDEEETTEINSDFGEKVEDVKLNAETMAEMTTGTVEILDDVEEAMEFTSTVPNSAFIDTNQEKSDVPELEVLTFLPEEGEDIYSPQLEYNTPKEENTFGATHSHQFDDINVDEMEIKDYSEDTLADVDNYGNTLEASLNIPEGTLDEIAENYSQNSTEPIIDVLNEYQEEPAISLDDVLGTNFEEEKEEVVEKEEATNSNFNFNFNLKSPYEQ